MLPQPLPQAALDILGVLGAEGVAAEAVRIAGVVKSDVTYWKNRFVRSGALVQRESQDQKTLGKLAKDQRFSAGRPKYYDLTPYGSKLLTGVIMCYGCRWCLRIILSSSWFCVGSVLAVLIG